MLGKLPKLDHCVKASSVVDANVSGPIGANSNDSTKAFGTRAAGGLASQTGFDRCAEVVVLNVAVGCKVIVVVVGRVVVSAVVLVAVVVASFAVGRRFHDPSACSSE